MNHVNLCSAHLGDVKSLLMLQERYSWNDMANDVRDVLGSCERCLAYNQTQKTKDP